MDNLRLYNQNKGLSVLLTFAFGPFGLLYTKNNRFFVIGW